MNLWEHTLISIDCWYRWNQIFIQLILLNSKQTTFHYRKIKTIWYFIKAQLHIFSNVGWVLKWILDKIISHSVSPLFVFLDRQMSISHMENILIHMFVCICTHACVCQINIMKCQLRLPYVCHLNSNLIYFVFLFMFFILRQTNKITEDKRTRSFRRRRRPSQQQEQHHVKV